jgi:hypothetical protein
MGREVKFKNPALEKNVKDGAPEVQIQTSGHPPFLSVSRDASRESTPHGEKYPTFTFLFMLF